MCLLNFKSKNLHLMLLRKQKLPLLNIQLGEDLRYFQIYFTTIYASVNTVKEMIGPMMSDLQPTDETVTTISKNPIAYMLAIAIVLLGIFVYRSFTVDDIKNTDCKEVVAAERQRSERAELRAEQSQRQLVEFLMHRDSAIRANVGNRAKEIIKNAKNHEQ